ncbi:hypothetical protein FACS1894202_09800 [Clostridia bacterium]|nr:hypothetical protein FACS1894202_09800 [Clostridia bacterium]
MNILDAIAAILNIPGIFKGFLPDKPDTAVAVTEYDGGNAPAQYFGATAFSHSVQARSRSPDAAAAYQKAAQIAIKLNRHDNAGLSVLQTSPILDIGMDNKSRHEYTVNFKITRKD